MTMYTEKNYDGLGSSNGAYGHDSDSDLINDISDDDNDQDSDGTDSDEDYNTDSDNEPDSTTNDANDASKLVVGGNSTNFVHLRLHSTYSMAEGAIKTEQLIELCEKNRMPAIAVTDSNNIFGAMEFSTKLTEHGIQYILGTQLNIKHPKETKNLDHPTSVLLYAKNRNGYENLIQLITSAYLEATNNDYPETSLDALAHFSDDVILATGGMYGSLGAFLLNDDVSGAKEYLEFLQKTFGDRLYIELSRHDNFNEQQIENRMVDLAYDYNIPLLATNNVCFPEKNDFEAHDALICIAQLRTIYDPDRQASNPQFYFKTPQEMTELFSDLPEAIENTLVVAERCSYCLKKIKPFMPQFKSPDGKSQEEALRDMAKAGLEERFEKLKATKDIDAIRPQYEERLNYEISIIEKMGFSGYFLIVADYVRWAKSQNIPVGPGRGSGAGSIVAWTIRITDVDPIRFKLFFERFLNPDRVSMPDFDVDFCQERRDEVMFYVQRKYGYDSVSQIITFGKLQAKAVVRDIGRVLALPYIFVDKLAKAIPFNPADPTPLSKVIKTDKNLQEMIESDPQLEHLIKIALRLEGLNRHASVHAAGVVISDRILRKIVPLYKDHRSTMPVTQFSMKYVESAGLIKFDFLGLKTLTVIQRVLDFIKRRGVDLHSQDIPLDDQKTFQLLNQMNCVGVFQIESGGMRDVLKKLCPDKIEDLIALVALYRPGPMDDIPKYIACKHGREPIRYLHEKLKPILEETYGVMVYQEQVMQIAQEIGGYTLGQADILRRAMGKKNKEEMKAQKKRFIDGAVERGVDLNIAETLFEQMNKFAGYGFNKSHSTPYGILTYQTAYLKANYMLEFFAAIMTIDSGNSDKLYGYYQDAKKNGIKIIPPDINLSDEAFRVNYEDNSIHYSLAAIKGSSDQTAKEIVDERKAHGNFKSIFDFFRRISKKIGTKKILDAYIKAGVFDSLHPNRHQLLDSVQLIIDNRDNYDQTSLFENGDPDFDDIPMWSETEKLQNEITVIGFYVSSHPLEQYKEILKELHLPTLSEALEMERVKVVVVVNQISYKSTKEKRRYGIIRVSDESTAIDMWVFPETLADSNEILQVGNVVALGIHVNHANDALRITVDSVQPFDKNFTIEDAAVRSFGGKKFKRNFKKEDSNEVHSVSSYQPPQNQLLQIRVGGIDELQRIKNFINNFHVGGPAKVELTFSDGKKIMLPEKYSVTSYDILDLRDTVGVKNVELKNE